MVNVCFDEEKSLFMRHFAWNSLTPASGFCQRGLRCSVLWMYRLVARDSCTNPTPGLSRGPPPAPRFLCSCFQGVSFRVISEFNRTRHAGTPALCPHWPCPPQASANQQEHGWESHTVWVRAPGLSESQTRWDTCCVSWIQSAYSTYLLMYMVQSWNAFKSSLMPWYHR